MKRAYEQKYTDGYFITKRGEKVESPKYNAEHIINLTRNLINMNSLL